MKNVLIICTANKVRSVMAMEIARSITAKKNLQYYFQSAGIAVIGSDIDANVKRVLMENGIKTEHIPTHIDDFDINKFADIHVMTERHGITLCSYYKEDNNLKNKITVLNIDDPFGKGIEAYRECYGKLAEFYKNYIV